MQPKTAIVTGASSGIGKAIAEKLAAEKMNVALVARSGDTLTSIAEELTSKYDANVIAVPTDVSNQSEIEEMVQQVEDAFGFIDVYVNNAGLMLDAAVTNGSLDKWEQMIDVNIKGVLYGLHQVIPQMIAKKSGHIIHIPSADVHEEMNMSTVYSAIMLSVREISMGLERDLAFNGGKVTDRAAGMFYTSRKTGYELKL